MHSGRHASGSRRCQQPEQLRYLPQRLQEFPRTLRLSLSCYRQHSACAADMAASTTVGTPSSNWPRTTKVRGPMLASLLANNLNKTGVTASIGDPFNLGSEAVVYPAANPFNQVQWFIDPTSYKMPYSDQWNFGVEQQVGKVQCCFARICGRAQPSAQFGRLQRTWRNFRGLAMPL